VRGGAGRSAFTLVEMLIAMALTLILVYAIAEFYAYVGTTVKDGRAMIDMVAQLRTASARLKADLELVTVPMGVYKNDGYAPGYFEICEGGNGTGRVCSDADSNGNNRIDAQTTGAAAEDTSPTDGVNDFVAKNITNLYGDTDDILACTIRTDGAPFTGRAYNPVTSSFYNISSTLAEVVWFTSFTDTNGNGILEPDQGDRQFLNRRLLLVVPGIVAGLPAGATADQFYQYNDVSARYLGAPTNGWVPNNFVDLSRRENRFAHSSPALPANNTALFPHVHLLQPHNLASLTAFTLQGDNFGEDRLLANVLSFDVRVYDPGARIHSDGDTTANQQGTVQPGDPGYLNVIQSAYSSSRPPGSYNPVGYGAYVDLGYGDQLFDQLTAQGVAAATARAIIDDPYPFTPPTSFPPASPFRWQTNYQALLGRTFDTWALSYERDGINQDGDALTDEGTNGFDDDTPPANGVDDPGERETVPPYPVALRGIQVRLRMYEPTTRQVRQATVGWDFISE
jgi:prepilin-type N-terminal cleavage/methylation domain-containing protein